MKMYKFLGDTKLFYRLEEGEFLIYNEKIHRNNYKNSIIITNSTYKHKSGSSRIPTSRIATE